jgi:hypothetical protein
MIEGMRITCASTRYVKSQVCIEVLKNILLYYLLKELICYKQSRKWAAKCLSKTI